MAKIILFDIDDTLFPTSEFSLLARRNAIRAMVSMGIGKEEEELLGLLMGIVKEKGSNYDHHFDDLCKKLDIASPARYVAAAIAAYHDTKTAIAPYPGVPKTLLELRDSGFELYVATNGKAIKQWDKLLRLHIALYFRDVFVSDEVGCEKGPEFFKKVAGILGAKPGDCIMVGDREDSDIAPAKSIGMAAIRLKKGKFRDASTSADFEVEEFSHLASIVAVSRNSNPHCISGEGHPKAAAGAPQGGSCG